MSNPNDRETLLEIALEVTQTRAYVERMRLQLYGLGLNR
jgi:hypothetical protein